MFVTKPYQRERAVAYARRWALGRNPLFVDYTGRGGNCTNFVSQCLLAGSCTMNYTPLYGWYYITENERTASWTGVPFLYNFLLREGGVGPFALEVEREGAMPGDVIQLFREREGWYHTLFFVGEGEGGEVLVAAHSDDALDRPLTTYNFDSARYLHIGGVILEIPDTGACFDALINGEKIE